MEKNLHIIFREITPRPQENLCADIWNKIQTLDKRKRRRQMYAYGAIGVFSFVALVPVVEDLLTQFSQSGFYEYISLAFSDTATLSVYWKELGLSIVDALPATSLILSFSLLFIFLISIKRVAHRLRAPLITA
jgi:hypothetical protein